MLKRYTGEVHVDIIKKGLVKMQSVIQNHTYCINCSAVKHIYIYEKN